MNGRLRISQDLFVSACDSRSRALSGDSDDIWKWAGQDLPQFDKISLMLIKEFVSIYSHFKS
jgi:hypothetical protein